jgi:hypothetical protein
LRLRPSWLRPSWGIRHEAILPVLQPPPAFRGPAHQDRAGAPARKED